MLVEVSGMCEEQQTHLKPSLSSTTGVRRRHLEQYRRGGGVVGDGVSGNPIVAPSASCGLREADGPARPAPFERQTLTT